MYTHSTSEVDVRAGRWAGVGLAMAVCGALLGPWNVEADQHRASGKGLLLYSDNTTTPQKRQWNFGNTSFDTEGATLVSRNPFQVVVKASPVTLNEWFAAINDNAGNLDILRSTDGGSTWSTSLAAATIGSIGGTGTTRRFDIAYEQQSGEAVVAYSKDATTNEIGIRRWDGTQWVAETLFDPTLTSAVVTWIELAEKRNSDELGLAYVTNASSNNLNGAIWSGSTNSFGNEPAANVGTCDQTAATPDGVDKCFDMNYETGSGLPVISWGISDPGNNANTIRASRWGGSSWTTTTISLGATGDDGTVVDCEANPQIGSNEIACISYGASVADVQSWTVVAGATGVTNANIDAASHAASAGKIFVAATYVLSQGNRRAVVTGSDSTSDNQIDYSVFDGSTWTNASFAKTFGTEENALAVCNPYDASEALFVFSDVNSDLWAAKVTLSGTTLTWSNADGAAALEASLGNIVGRAYDLAFEPQRPRSTLTLSGYTFENDDEDQANGDAVDENTVQAGSAFASGTTITSVKKGERVTTRMQLKNTGSGPLASSLALFYDRNDNIWTKVADKPLAATPSGCTGSDGNWTCTTVDDPANTVGLNASLALDPSGNAWVSYRDTTANSLKVARYTPGTAASGGCAADWTCTVVDDPTNAVGNYTSLAFDPAGNPWVSYVDTTATTLKLAQYVGSGGTGCTGGTDNTAWTCTVIDDQTLVDFTSLAFDPTGSPWISYSTSSFKVARYTPGTAASGGCAANWTCTTVVPYSGDPTPTSFGEYNSLAFDPAGNAWVSFRRYGTTMPLLVARYVGSGGTGDTGGAWTYTYVASPPGDQGSGLGTSLAFDPAGNAWVSHVDEDFSVVNFLFVARYVGSGGTGCDVTDWTCATVDAPVNGVGTLTSLAFDPSGKAWVSYQDNATSALKLARYVGSGGTGCTGTTAWTCTTVDDPANVVGEYSSLVFDAAGNAWVSYQDATATTLKVARISRGGEIQISPGLAAAGSDAVNESHADMTSATDTVGRDDADCIGGGTWNNGKWFESTEASGLTMPKGNATAQCTELAVTIDTAQATAGTTYRVIAAAKDNWRTDKGPWRGPGTISQFPTLAIESSTTTRIAKDNTPKFPDCTDTAWGCTTVDNPANDVGSSTALAVDPSGNAWVSYYDGTALSLKVARYVGSGGTGCGGGTTAWTCTTVDDPANDVGDHTSLAFDPSGNAWVSYLDSVAGSLKLARYVGSGGTGCTSGAWTCTTVDEILANPVLDYTALAFDPSGNAWVSYYEAPGDGFCDNTGHRVQPQGG
ncbi:MAG: hypothetical protein Q8R91_07315 [Candidatus Omnitrophota bacterium]|nr:hypothetical protein [Candidatus Omnitrophota bacterium]